MSDSNPAIPQSESPQNRDILAKVNAHADRSMDRLFADIDELLSDDLSTNNSAAAARSAQQNTYSPAPASTDDRYSVPPQAQFAPAAGSTGIDAPPTATPKPKRSMPMWLKAFIGIGITSVAAAGIGTWLVREQKIALPQNIDTSWLPFQSPRVAPADAKFADYLRQSIAKIETAERAPVAATPTAPVTNPVATAPTPQAVPFTANPIVPATQIPVKTAIVAAKATPRILKTPISLVKTLPDGKRPGAIFQIDRQNKTVDLGQKIGTSDWSLLAVSKGEITIKRKGGEIRSIDVGQKF
ncbi:hypothetical protein [Chamaesiphon sp. GL140_3_metabinner_50]|uniref:hypothetical protein n=1 Tax=Chamaesiphon sp. GL140_3_metabinner_50 TaxID=2970812 RepID=UPI0025E338D8|nr:hypothetical protein [Chamaesiphon sp. GL140_3_metabinner_50]